MKKEKGDYPLTKALIIINVLIFIIVFSMPENMANLVFSMLSYSGSQIFELWRLLTSTFLHASASHLFFNMLGLYFFGRVMEDETKPKIFLMIYFAAGIAGNILHGLFDATPVVGASGCIFGLTGAAMLIKPAKPIKMFLFPIPLGIIAILFGVAETMLAYSPAVADGVAHLAHIGGLFAGGAITFRKMPKESMKGILWLIIFVIVLVIVGPLFSIILNIGNTIIGVIDIAVGFVLYGIARIISIIWL